MTQEDKKLLLRDLCCRLPYGVKVVLEKPYIKGILKGIVKNIFGYHCQIESSELYSINIESIKPYLRSTSSMTEEEDFELDETRCYTQLTLESYDWLNAHHFDYRGLIEKGLALEAPEGMYNIKEK